MTKDLFYYRLKGQIVGPLTPAELQDGIRSGRITRVHEVSQDRATWYPLLDCADLLQSLGLQLTVAPRAAANLRAVPVEVATPTPDRCESSVQEGSLANLGSERRSLALETGSSVPRRVVELPHPEARQPAKKHALRPASKGKRVAAALVDFVLIPSVIGVGLGLVLGVAKTTESQQASILTGVGVGLNIVWPVLRDSVGSPGRALAGVRLLKVDGTRVGIGTAIGRNLHIMIPFVLVAGFVVELVSMLASGQRVADRWARTIVVEKDPGKNSWDGRSSPSSGVQRADKMVIERANRPSSDLTSPTGRSVAAFCGHDGCALKIAFEPSELIRQFQRVLEKRLAKQHLFISWQLTSEHCQLVVRFTLIDQGNQFVRWLCPLIAPAEVHIEGELATDHSSTRRFRHEKRAHVGLFGGGAKYMLGVCADRLARVVANEVLPHAAARMSL